MGRLADDITRLCGEISALRNAREAFINNLRINWSRMLAGFREDCSRRRDDTSALRFNVSRMLADFREDHSKMAHETKAELGTFVSDLKANVAEKLAGFQAEMADAHQAWIGGSLTAERKVQRRGRGRMAGR
jgi:hypothetical protein